MKSIEYNFTNFAIIISSSDNYDDLWDNFFSNFFSNFPPIIKDVYLVNGVKPYLNTKVKTINTGENILFTKRLKKTLDSIDSEYVLFMLEDYFICEKVKISNIVDILEFIQSNQIVYYKLDSFSNINGSSYNGKPYLKLIPKKLRYGISLQTSIWNKRFLLELIGDDNLSPWEFEKKISTKTIFHHDNKIVFDSRNIIKISHMVTKGKYINRSKKRIRSSGYFVDNKMRKTHSFISEFLILIIFYLRKSIFYTFLNRIK
jgi:hypothetical protein